MTDLALDTTAEIDAFVDHVVAEHEAYASQAVTRVHSWFSPAWQAVRGLVPGARVPVLLRMLERMPELAQPDSPSWAQDQQTGTWATLRAFSAELLRGRPEMSVAELTNLVLLCTAAGGPQESHWVYVQPLVDAFVAEHDLQPQLHDALADAWRRLDFPPLLTSVGQRLGELLGEVPTVRTAAEATAAAAAPEKRAAWTQLLAHAKTATQSRPSRTWLARAEGLVAAVGAAELAAVIPGWLAVLDAGSKLPLTESEAQYVKGIAWVCSELEDVRVVRALARAAELLYQWLGIVGFRSQLGGNACVLALGLMPGTEPAMRLLHLRQRVKDKAATKAIEKALADALVRSGLSREQLEEEPLAVPGLDADGRMRITAAGFLGEVIIDGLHAREVRWTDAEGKPCNSVPTEVRAQPAGALRDLQQSRKVLGQALAAQRDRLDALLLAERTWPIAVWRERYLDHPLVRHLARRLIWQIREGETETAVLWLDGQLVDDAGLPIPARNDTASVSLWHPLVAGHESSQRWRALIEERGVVQPFKQAHRELYLLTDAERATNTYSNRYAAHIVRQHQFKALCDARGWRYSLLGVWDTMQHPVAVRPLPERGLRVEFWVTPAGNLDYGSDGVAESGTYLYLATDQVRFCGEGDRPLPLDQVPALIFSELMRDVDLFVGVAGIEADPNWTDRAGATGFRDHWREQSFGDLTQSAVTRRDVLARLLPKLKIADRCTLDGRFLVVRGDLQSYRIHLGSGNILMSPGDRYLCIVPSPAALNRAPERDVRLPFEGDGLLSVIISKAFLLADDRGISDPTIVTQLRVP